MQKTGCQLCGSIYQPKRNTSRFCSAYCRKRSSRRAKTFPKPEKNCFYCGSWQMTYMGLRSDAKYCSSKCKQAAYRIGRLA